MKGSSFFAELKSILSNRNILIPILAVTFVPVLYAGMFLWAFWDPYDHMEDLPVAIVNEDAGANFEGNELQLGKELTDKLSDNNNFNFHIVSKEDGYKGLENRDYYLLVEIPEDFSSNATTLLDSHPQKLELKYVPNESTNFLSSQIGETAIEKIKTEISKNVTATYAETMFDKVQDLADGLTQASDGSKQLAEGVAKVNDGSKTLEENVAVLASKSIEFTDGVQKASSGASDLAAGTDQVKAGLREVNEKLPSLVNGTNQVQDGVALMKDELPEQIAEGITAQLNESVGQVDVGLDELETKLSTGLPTQLTNGIADKLSKSLADQMIASQTQQMGQLKAALIENQIMDEAHASAFIAQMAQGQPTRDELQEQLKQQLIEQLKPSITAGVSNGLDQGFSQFKTGLHQQFGTATAGLKNKLASQTAPSFNRLLAGLQQVNEGQVSLQQGIDKLYNGSVALQNGAQDLTAGMGQLTNGAGQLQNGAGQLAEGSKELKEGTVQLADGSAELAGKLAEGAEQANSVEANDETYDMMGEPVTVKKQEINTVPNYGTGFAPYFISLGLFVGALLMSIVFKLKEPVIQPKNAFRWFFSKFGVLAIVGVIQAILVDFILLEGLKIEVASIPLFFITSLITSFVFLTLIQMLVTMMGDPGRFIAIVILILQLTTSAGTFPLELIPNALQPINALLPMTYSVQSFKAVISSGDFAYMWHNNLILLTYMVAFMAITIGYFAIKMKKENVQVEMN
ncbi:YhgE/Pip domain-containing protein [Fredinandcohnia sp. QZ13]|uniref:YhgE/Pip domain-containing protein n=1 Tax=Fredinandcohnia sp. QZ13 TaxID=3073144 RepID=UPI002853492E|nr:YhgE/Pip domain-containing protein [Fredinandcohnia sp. QZ13]MDR4890316.1 YhgE/Pip domain-containing protein [Fredinandcohnia sp. QZ13]